MLTYNYSPINQKFKNHIFHLNTTKNHQNVFENLQLGAKCSLRGRSAYKNTWLKRHSTRETTRPILICPDETSLRASPFKFPRKDLWIVPAGYELKQPNGKTLLSQHNCSTTTTLRESVRDHPYLMLPPWKRSSHHRQTLSSHH